MGKTQNQQGFGALELLLVLVAIGLLVGVSFFIWSRQDDSPRPTRTTQNTPDEETPTEVVIPEGYTTHTNAAAGFAVAFPTAWGELKALAKPKLQDATFVSQELDRAAIDSPASVLSGPARITVTPKATFTITMKYSVTVKPIKDKDRYTWEVTEINPAETTHKVGGTYRPKTVTTQSGLTAFDFSWDDEGSSYGRWVFEAGNSFVTVELPRLWTPDGAAYAETPPADLDLYANLSEEIISTAHILN